MKKLTSAQERFLMYLETCVVDCAGAVDSRRINDEEVEWMKKWTKDGFIESGRICYDDIDSTVRHCKTIWVRFNNDSWTAAHQVRVARAGRMWEKKRYKTTGEKREGSKNEQTKNTSSGSAGLPVS